MNIGEQAPVTRWPRARAPVSGTVPWWRFLIAGLGHGLFMYLAFPPASVWPLAFLALCPLVWAACKGAATPVRAGVWTSVGVVPFWIVEQAWLIDVTGPGYPALVVYLSLYTFVFVWAVATARGADWPIPMSVVVPIGWIGLEVLRGSVIFSGYAFFLLGHPLIDNAALAAPAAVFGAYSVSFLCACLAGALADATGWSGLPRHAGGIAALATVVLWTVLAFVGEWTGKPGPTRDVRIAVIQTNVATDNKMAWSIGQRLRDFRRFGELTRQAAAHRPEPDLIVWPETMFPGISLNESAAEAVRESGLSYRLNDPEFPPNSQIPMSKFADDLLKMQSEIGVSMLIGAICDEGLTFVTGENGRITWRSDKRFNSAVVVRDGRVQDQRYDKVDLMPFGEVIPYIWRWPSLQEKVLAFGVAGMSFDLAFGEHAVPLDVPIGRAGSSDRPSVVRLATPICFEVTRSSLCRRLVRGESGEPAGAIVNLSNDGWFGASDAGRRTHMLAARWRSVELGLPLVRAANTGISVSIDWRGRVVNDRVEAPGTEPSRSNSRVDGVLVATVPVEKIAKMTIFSRLGDWPMFVIAIGSALGTLLAWRRRRVQSRLGV